jgi:hypothetical protein
MSYTTAAISQDGGRPPGSGMDESLRKQVLIALERLGRKYPAMRLGQIVCFAALLARGPSSKAAWEVSDEDMLRAALEHLAGHPNP